MKRKPRRHKLGGIIILSAIMAMITAFLYIFSVSLRPALIRVSQAYAKNVVSQVIDDEVKKVMLEEFFSYDKIVVISRDKDGKVTSVSANSTLINRFTNDLGISIGDELDKISRVKRKIPLSSVFGADLFSGLGPRITVRFVPISVTNADISHTFEEAGINQTIHTVNLTVTVDMEVLIPMAGSTLHINSGMPIAQTLIVGSVPGTYLTRVDGK